MKPGIKTSEFWLTALVVVLVALQPHVAEAPEAWAPTAARAIAAALAVLGALGYTRERTKVKSAQTVAVPLIEDQALMIDDKPATDPPVSADADTRRIAKAAPLLLACLLLSACGVTEQVAQQETAIQAKDDQITQGQIDDLRALGGAAVEQLDEALWQYLEADHERDLRALAGKGPLTVDGVLELRDRYAEGHAQRVDKIDAFEDQLDAAAGGVAAKTRAALQQASKSLLNAAADRTAATTALAGTAIDGAANVVDAAAAAKAERRARRAAEEEARRKAAEEEAAKEGK